MGAKCGSPLELTLACAAADLGSISMTLGICAINTAFLASSVPGSAGSRKRMTGGPACPWTGASAPRQGSNIRSWAYTEKTHCPCWWLREA